MKNLLCILLGGALAGLAGCHAAPDQAAATPAAGQAPAVVQDSSAAVSVAKPVAGPPFTGYHRYRGTVGGQSVTVELTVSQPALTREQAAHAQDFLLCEGSYRYDRHPAGRLLLSGPRPCRPDQPLLLLEADTARPQQPTGHWQATQPCGPMLTGTWRGPAGQALPFRLREDYTDGQGHVAAVQYELLQEGEEVPCQPERKKDESKAAYRARTQDLTSSNSRDFLHLLGPDTLRPALRALQCPVPARRQRLMREELGYPGRVELRNELSVTYNDYGLLSLATFYEGDYEGAVHPEHGAGATTYDLRTGRPLAIEALIHPGTDSTLARLLVQRLDEDMNSSLIELLNSPAADSTSAPLSQLGLGIGDEGLEFTYSNYYDSLTPPVTLLVPWAELRPLLRSDSPVARMLRERGLWPPRKSR